MMKRIRLETDASRVTVLDFLSRVVIVKNFVDKIRLFLKKTIDEDNFHCSSERKKHTVKTLTINAKYVADRSIDRFLLNTKTG